ncbi:U32 family peptidase [Candidatus Woesearchaeota archaeon]|nr:U32 family peptidase [Candidatus Woesearchaeota archaeon]
MRKKPEILAPVGNEVMLKAAILSDANAVYFGVKELNMRATANNFEVFELKKIVKICHENDVKAYLTLNTLVYDDELEKIKKIISEAKKAKINAIICWDMGVLKEALRQKVPVHLSTQAGVSNFEAVKYYSELGVKRIVLARECTLKQIKSIINKIEKEEVNVEIETFVHGAMCVSISGRCFMSQFLYGKSANRGKCIQPCRREYEVIDKETGDKLSIGNNYVMSPKDLCTITFIDKLIEAGIHSFKIEGRAKNPEYVKTVVGSYKKAVDAYFEGKYTEKLAKELEEELKKVYHRGFSKGFYMGIPINEFTDSYGGKQDTKKGFVGYVRNYYKRLKVAEIKVESNSFKVGDTLMIQGPTTGVVEEKVKSMQVNYKDVDTAKKSKSVAVKFDTLLRPNDKVFLIR